MPASRILVALDTASECHSTLEVAARVALQTEAKLVALFIEDTDLIRLAGLPFATELSRTSAAERRLEPPNMARALRAQQQRVERALAQITERLAVRTSLRVVQGNYMSEAVAAATDMDILVLTRMAGTVVGRNLMLDSRRATARPARHEQKVSRPVCVLFDGTPAARRLLLAASRLSEHLGESLLILVSAGRTSYEACKQKAQTVIPTSVSYRTIATAPGGISTLVSTVNRARCSVLILQRSRVGSDETPFPALVEALDCCLMLVP
jgi:nucleotide-binding universal stress UspA family protein